MTYRVLRSFPGFLARVGWILIRLPQLAVLAALIASGLYLLIAATRIAYPYDLDFIENSMLMQSLRVANGLPVYLPPNVEFTPHVYMPLYMTLSGWLLKATGPGYAPLRLLSFGATLVTASLIYAVARREGGRRWLAVACAGLYFGGYRIVDGWYELVRVDSLFVSASLAAFALGSYARKSWRALMALAAVMALVFFVKQTGVVFAIALGAWLLARIGRRVIAYAVMYAGSVAGFLALAASWTGGWFGYYTFGIASSNPVELQRIADYGRFELFGLMAALSLMAIAAAALAWRRGGRSIVRDQPWWLGFAAAMAASGLGRASVGGAMNNLMPVYAFLCLSPALLIKEWDAAVARRLLHPVTSLVRLSERREAVVAALILAQFALGVYNPMRFLPTDDMRAAGDRLIARVASIDGEVFVMMHPYYALLAGKQPSAQIAVVWHGRERGQLPLPDDLVRRVEDRYYAAIISDESLFEIDPPLRDVIEANYTRSETLADAESPPVMSGMFVRPRVVYVPRVEAP